MITLHHLKIGRSIFMAWQLEELGLAYETKIYEREKTFRAPDTLKAIHPLGKSPVIEDQGMVIAESGAITSYLLATYDQDNKWSPSKSDIKAWTEYTQWLHYPEGSAFAPMLIAMLSMQEGKSDGLLKTFADGEVKLHMDYIENQLKDKDFILGDSICAADFGMGYIANMANGLGMLNEHPNTKAYAERIMARPAFAKAKEKVGS